MNVCLFLVCIALSGGEESAIRTPSLPIGEAGPTANVLSKGATDRWLAEDKFQHFFASFAVTLLAAGAARAAGLEARESVVAGAGAGVGAGVWKEVRDAGRPGGHFSVRDLVWDLAGVGAGIAISAQAR